MAKGNNGIDIALDLLLTTVSSSWYVNHIRKHLKKYPGQKKQVIEALELFLQELKNSK